MGSGVDGLSSPVEPIKIEIDRPRLLAGWLEREIQEGKTLRENRSCELVPTRMTDGIYTRYRITSLLPISTDVGNIEFCPTHKEWVIKIFDGLIVTREFTAKIWACLAKTAKSEPVLT